MDRVRPVGFDDVKPSLKKETGRPRWIPNVLQNRGTVPPFKGAPRSNVCNIFPVDLSRFGILPHAHLTLGSVQHFSGRFLHGGQGGYLL